MDYKRKLLGAANSKPRNWVINKATQILLIWSDTITFGRIVTFSSKFIAIGVVIIIYNIYYHYIINNIYWYWSFL